MKLSPRPHSTWLRWLLGGALIFLARPAAPAAEAQHPLVQYVFGLSPFLDDAVKDQVYRGLVRFVLEDLPLNTSLRLYDAYQVRTIATIEVPDAQAFRSAKTRANQWKDRIQELKRFLATTHERPQAQGIAFDEAIRLPQFLDFIGGQPCPPGPAVAGGDPGESPAPG